MKTSSQDVFSRHFIAYSVTDASATVTAKDFIDIITKHTYFPTTLITDKGLDFTSKRVDEIAQILEKKTIQCATMKNPQTNDKLERTINSLNTNLKMTQGEYRRRWQKCLPLAVLNYNTTYHTTLGCEPSKLFHGRTSYSILDKKLGLNPSPNALQTTDFADEFQRQTKNVINPTK